FLRIGLDDARDAETVGAHGPAHDGGIPDLHAAEVAEAHDEWPIDARDVRAVAEPEADPIPPRRLDRLHDAIESLAPAHGSPPVHAAAAVPHERLGETAAVVRDLHGGLAADAEKAAAVRILRVALDREHAPVLGHVDEHAAEGGMAIHGAHRADGAARHGRDHTSPLPRAQSFC